MMTARFMRFCSSRILPGQVCALRAVSASALKPLTLRPCSALKRLRKCCARIWGVGLAVAQRRDADHHLVETVEQILTKPPGAHQVLQILMGRADDADIDRNRLPAADPLDHAFLQEAEQLDLKRQRQIADLVQHQGAAVGQLDLALGQLDGRR